MFSYVVLGAYNYVPPSLFKALCCSSYWPLVSYPMGKCALILKGSAIYSAVLAAAVKVLCSYYRVYLWLYHVLYYAVSPFGNTILLYRLYA